MTTKEREEEEDRDVVSVVVVAVVLWVLVSCVVVADSWFSSSTCVSPPCSQNAIVACYFLFTRMATIKNCSARGERKGGEGEGNSMTIFKFGRSTVFLRTPSSSFSVAASFELLFKCCAKGGGSERVVEKGGRGNERRKEGFFEWKGIGER